MKVMMGLPKGSLQEMTVKIMNRAGYGLRVAERSYMPESTEPGLQPVMLRAQEIPRYVSDGSLDAGIAGEDWIAENRAKVKMVTVLGYSKASFRPIRWVLAVPEKSPIRKVSDLKGKRLATELVVVTKQFLKQHRVTAQVEFSWGATEVKVPRFADAIVEATETGSSLRANRLRVIDTVFSSQTVLFANPVAWNNPEKRKIIEELGMLMRGVVDAEGQVGLKMNVKQSDLRRVLKVLPALMKPTVSPLADAGWMAVETVLEEKMVHKLLPRLIKQGAQGIVEYPLNKIIH
jgi:ATP phosphoribosyltransferase